MNDATSWWDGIELWVVGLPFIPQVALVVVVVLPIAAAIALVLDRAVSELTKLNPRGKSARREAIVSDGTAVER
ncbi:hypothetical protein GCM10007304_16030 [Rhodococcoides trifolii]|uniref:Uncharacterized protein n=1 Tax=Rhodococcoides trifolii TaxID=908250 RepID=A0A917FUS9_9NOCA|nr:hypothetical protein [Rhodococcus trifolii]GGG02767.1 hypothetical protein GCM10007304_16030 [Rhodococcus trifolii]